MMNVRSFCGLETSYWACAAVSGAAVTGDAVSGAACGYATDGWAAYGWAACGCSLEGAAYALWSPLDSS